MAVNKNTAIHYLLGTLVLPCLLNSMNVNADEIRLAVPPAPSAPAVVPVSNATAPATRASFEMKSASAGLLISDRLGNGFIVGGEAVIKKIFESGEIPFLFAGAGLLHSKPRSVVTETVITGDITSPTTQFNGIPQFELKAVTALRPDDFELYSTPLGWIGFGKKEHHLDSGLKTYETDVITGVSMDRDEAMSRGLRTTLFYGARDSEKITDDHRSLEGSAELTGEVGAEDVAGDRMFFLQLALKADGRYCPFILRQGNLELCTRAGGKGSAGPDLFNFKAYVGVGVKGVISKVPASWIHSIEVSADGMAEYQIDVMGEQYTTKGLFVITAQ